MVLTSYGELLISKSFELFNTILTSGIALYIIKEQIEKNKTKKEKLKEEQEQIKNKDPFSSLHRKDKLRSIEELIYNKFKDTTTLRVIAPWYFKNGTYKLNKESLKEMSLSDETFNHPTVPKMIDSLQNVRFEKYERIWDLFKNDSSLTWAYSNELEHNDGIAEMHKSYGGNHIYIFPVKHRDMNINVGVLVLKFETFPNLSLGDIEWLEIQAARMWDCI